MYELSQGGDESRRNKKKEKGRREDERLERIYGWIGKDEMDG